VGPLNRYSVVAVAMVTAAGVILRPSGLFLTGLVLLALSVHLFVWNPEHKHVFRDDWVEIAQVGAMLTCGMAGLGLLVTAGALAALK
jgi:hypothetical protein